MERLLLFFSASSLGWQSVLILAGIVMVLWGAHLLTEGAVALARRMHIPQIVIGLTIVAMGTSMPEFCVSLVSALRGTPDLAVGNVVGSNTFNALLIVGCAAMVMPIAILKSTVRKDMPFGILASGLLAVLCYDGTISRLDAAVLFALFLLFMWYTLRSTKQEADDTDSAPQMPLWRSALYMGVGLFCLIFGSSVFVDNASSLAVSLGVSQAVVGLTIVAGGTSLPELATSIVAARKGDSGIAIGNVLGSNVFNILMILGMTGIIQPMQIAGITMTDLLVMLFSMVLLWLFSYTKYRISRLEGVLLSALFVCYTAWLIYHA